MNYFLIPVLSLSLPGNTKNSFMSLGKLHECKHFKQSKTKSMKMNEKGNYFSNA